MYGRYLIQAAEICGIQDLKVCGLEMIKIGDLWQEIARSGKELHNHPADAMDLLPISQKLTAIAELEQALWSKIEILVTQAE
jgi:hypothetical protein